MLPLRRALRFSTLPPPPLAPLLPHPFPFPRGTSCSRRAAPLPIISSASYTRHFLPERDEPASRGHFRASSLLDRDSLLPISPFLLPEEFRPRRSRTPGPIPFTLVRVGGAFSRLPLAGSLLTLPSRFPPHSTTPLLRLCLPMTPPSGGRHPFPRVSPSCGSLSRSS